MLTSYHVHSTFSDGQTDIAAIIAGANKLGLDQVGISDHYTVMPGGKAVPWSMGLDQLEEYIASIEEAAKGAGPGLTVLHGVEADFFPESIDEIEERLVPHRLDYVIGSVHFYEDFPIDENAENWEKLNQGERDDIIKGYWTRIKQMAETGFFSFAGHLDLYKKFGHEPSVDISSYIDEALDAIARSGMAVELNTAGLHVPAREIYPSPAILSGCRVRNIPVLINADAHTPANLVRSYDEAKELLGEVGYDIRDMWRVSSR